MKYLRTRDLCEMFSVSIGTLYNWRNEGMPFIGSKGPGLAIFYEEDKVLEWLSSREVIKIEKEKVEVKETVKALYED